MYQKLLNPFAASPTVTARLHASATDFSCRRVSSEIEHLQWTKNATSRGWSSWELYSGRPNVTFLTAFSGVGLELQGLNPKKKKKKMLLFHVASFRKCDMF